MPTRRWTICDSRWPRSRPRSPPGRPVCASSRASSGRAAVGQRARALPPEVGAEAGGWADIAQTTIASHQRALDTVAPWIEALDDVRRALPADAREAADAVVRLLDAPPPLGSLPELARTA